MMVLSPTRQPSDEAGQDSFSAEFMRLYGAICAIPTVGVVGLAADHDQVDLWVRLAEHDEEHEERIYRRLQEYRASAASVPVDLHVILPDETKGAFPSTVRVVYER